MKSWKEVPHLFANGKFEVKINGGNKFQLVGCQPSTVFEGEEAILFYNMSGQIVEKPVLNCTLIARPISDMSDEEYSKCEDLWHDIVYGPLGERNEIMSAQDAIERIAEKEVDAFLYLLSIGVYPFDQSHFESGEVIARYVNGEES